MTVSIWCTINTVYNFTETNGSIWLKVITDGYQKTLCKELKAQIFSNISDHRRIQILSSPVLSSTPVQLYKLWLQSSAITYLSNMWSNQFSAGQGKMIGLPSVMSLPVNQHQHLENWTGNKQLLTES